MTELKRDYTIVIVTHNMQQAARVSDRTAFFTAEVVDEHRRGRLVEYDRTEVIFTRPTDSRTEDYITGQVRMTPTGKAIDDGVGAHVLRCGDRVAGRGAHRARRLDRRVVALARAR